MQRSSASRMDAYIFVVGHQTEIIPRIIRAAVRRDKKYFTLSSLRRYPIGFRCPAWAAFEPSFARGRIHHRAITGAALKQKITLSYWLGDTLDFSNFSRSHLHDLDAQQRNQAKVFDAADRFDKKQAVVRE